MENEYYSLAPNGDIICHYGIPGMEWGKSFGKIVDSAKLKALDTLSNVTGGIRSQLNSNTSLGKKATAADLAAKKAAYDANVAQNPYSTVSRHTVMAVANSAPKPKEKSKKEQYLIKYRVKKAQALGTAKQALGTAKKTYNDVKNKVTSSNAYKTVKGKASSLYNTTKSKLSSVTEDLKKKGEDFLYNNVPAYKKKTR